MPISVEHWVAILPQFCPILNTGGMKLEHYFFHASKSSEDRKKKSSPKIEEFLSPKSSDGQKHVQRPSSAQMQTIVKLLGRMQSNYQVGYILPGFGTPVGVDRIKADLHSIRFSSAFVRFSP